MLRSRVASDPELIHYTSKLEMLSDDKLQSLAVRLCKIGTEIVPLKSEFAEGTLQKLLTFQTLTNQELTELEEIAEEADNEYLDKLDVSGGDDPQCRSQFQIARILSALHYASRNTRESSLESIYESYVGSNRSAVVREEIHSFVDSDLV